MTGFSNGVNMPKRNGSKSLLIQMPMKKGDERILILELGWLERDGWNMGTSSIPWISEK
jgi:hypothetical protein